MTGFEQTIHFFRINPGREGQKGRPARPPRRAEELASLNITVTLENALQLRGDPRLANDQLRSRSVSPLLGLRIGVRKNTFRRDAINHNVLQQLRKHTGCLPGFYRLIGGRSNGEAHHIGTPDVTEPAIRENVSNINAPADERDKPELVARKNSRVDIKKVGVGRKNCRTVAGGDHLRHKILTTEEKANPAGISGVEALTLPGPKKGAMILVDLIAGDEIDDPFGELGPIAALAHRTVKRGVEIFVR